MNRSKQHGFSLVEIAIVLVIIGLLIGGILKGQEMINSAKVRGMADLSSGIASAYFGFIDRFRRVPGDWSASAATQAIGQSVSGGGDDNGRIDNDPAGGNAKFTEPNAMWEQLAAAGFLSGAYRGQAVPPNSTNGQTPLNPFNQPVLMGRTPDYRDSGTAIVRLNLMLGRSVPVAIMREFDVKIDDGSPDTGVLRLAADVGAGAVFDSLGESDPLCFASGEYGVASESQDCNSVFLY
ncbi:MAG: prepilin-type N-terminal cleavage/methylation domain-containing protein [Pseudomonadota bacterium]